MFWERLEIAAALELLGSGVEMRRYTTGRLGFHFPFSIHRGGTNWGLIHGV